MYADLHGELDCMQRMLNVLVPKTQSSGYNVVLQANICSMV